ncbi:hypothetical protein TVAG_025820 [Trichomonas vaginalis G3]|uniref:Uncharacterized protein n=1 Tax=Trichomonas vaginalis (strain ATCC PRA-98 / G3) TaxID=412133 RepID=A2F0K4_TRIV3|nr:armadillo (ARM) repeat-containing protein family [Trichomonas vaginalis G3]EAY01584.1 hypothetical protein TVAG_025820 [Trichomonas vaginalis G3]KAI5529801.1 armadillo (ARM) repeat-containing protein family [Trichomonas vaginalis G3]|eukprot:XP_001314225.1 hypothetical protein [Trichomonas vaginalis G3]
MLSKCLTNIKDEKTKSLLNKALSSLVDISIIDSLFDKLKESEKNWRCLHDIIEIIITIGMNNKEKFKEGNYLLKLIGFCIESLIRVKSSAYFQNANFRNVCEMFSNNKDLLNDEIINIIVEGACYIMQSTEHSTQFMQLVLEYNNNLAIKIAENVVNGTPGPSSRMLPTTFSALIKYAPKEIDQFSKFYMGTTRVNFENILTQNFTKVTPEVGEHLRKYGLEFMYRLLTDNSFEIRRSAEICLIESFESFGIKGILTEFYLTEPKNAGYKRYLFCDDRVKYPEEINKFFNYIKEKLIYIRDNTEKYFSQIPKDKEMMLLSLIRAYAYLSHKCNKHDKENIEFLIELMNSISKLKIMNDLYIIEFYKIINLNEFKNDEDWAKTKLPILAKPILEVPAKLEITLARTVHFLACYYYLLDEEFLENFLNNDLIKKSIYEMADKEDNQIFYILKAFALRFKDMIAKYVEPIKDKLYSKLEYGKMNLHKICGFEIPLEVFMNALKCDLNQCFKKGDMDFNSIDMNVPPNVDQYIDDDFCNKFNTICQKNIVESLNLENRDNQPLLFICYCNQIPKLAKIIDEKIKIIENSSKLRNKVLILLIKGIELRFTGTPEDRVDVGMEVLDLLLSTDGRHSDFNKLIFVANGFLCKDGTVIHYSWMTTFLSLITAKADTNVNISGILQNMVFDLTNDDVVALATAILESNPDKYSIAMILLCKEMYNRFQLIVDTIGADIHKMHSKFETIK